ncbi:MAG: VOC family protein [Rhodobacteraceae bacterium]|nr:VOC family protein [Paracoccaceae bacterium]
MRPDVTPMLMFKGGAEEAMTTYVSLFHNARIAQLLLYGPDDAGPEGSVLRGRMVIGEQNIYFLDTVQNHDFSFIPSSTLWVCCETKAEMDDAFFKLADGGQVLTEIGSYPFNDYYGWVTDRFGVSWHLSLTQPGGQKAAEL